MEWVLLLVVIGLAVYASRTRQVADVLAAKVGTQEALIRDLIQRVFALEHRPSVAERAAPAVEVEPAPVPVLAPEPEPEPEIQPEPVIATVSVEPEPVPVVPIEPLTPWIAPPVVQEQPKDWEAIIGGSWLQAIGILITVIGLALLLGLSLTVLGPGGKCAIGFAPRSVTVAACVWP